MKDIYYKLMGKFFMLDKRLYNFIKYLSLYIRVGGDFNR